MVRVHTGPAADAVARSLHADALTCGSDIYFRDGAYDPTTVGGRRLLAHEAVHVVQHHRTERLDADAGSLAVALSHPADASEREAARLAMLVAKGQPAHPAPTSHSRDRAPAPPSTARLLRASHAGRHAHHQAGLHRHGRL